MISQLRGAILLLAALLFFLVIIGMLAVGTIMRPTRWSERERPRVAV